MSEDLSEATQRALMLRYGQRSPTDARREDRALDSVKAEAYSHDERVWACADGQGFIEALMVDDEAIRDNSAEELEDLISDAMMEACTRGQVAGNDVLRKLGPPNGSAVLKSRNGKGITGI